MAACRSASLGRLYRRVVSSREWPASSATRTMSFPARTSRVRQMWRRVCAEVVDVDVDVDLAAEATQDEVDGPGGQPLALQ